LAEAGSGLDGWKALAAKFSGDNPDSQLAADLLLDALIYAPHSEMLLEQVWSDLAADDAHILKRLLQRLLHVASVPDWRFQDIGDESLAETTEALFRIPHPVYWIPALRVLRRHAREVSRLLSRLAAEVCALWLRTMPHGTIGRDEAGVLAVEVAKEIKGRQAAGRRLDKDSQVIFEALLYAAPDEPEVAQIALQLSGRLPEPNYALERAMELEEEQTRLLEEWERKNPTKELRRRVSLPGVTSFRRTRVIPPEPDGPQREIPEPFRSAVFNTPALTGLMSLQPEVTRETLLAVCIHDPDEEARDDEFDRLMGDRLGLSHSREGSPALPWKSGFLRFLNVAPETGIDTIVRLVNYATSKWLESIIGPNPTEQQRKEWALTLEVGERRVAWGGDGNVLAWNRSLAAKGPQVECALMALEQWFDEEVSKGHDVERWINYLFDQGESIAFAGVLISVGLKHPALFTTILQPLLGNYYLYDWQQAIAIAEPNKIWAIGLLHQPQLVVQNATKWHDQPHRRCLFPCLLYPVQDLLVLDLQFGISLCLLAYLLPEGVVFPGVGSHICQDGHLVDVWIVFWINVFELLMERRIAGAGQTGIAIIDLDEGITVMEVGVVIVSWKPAGSVVRNLVGLGSECLVLDKAAEGFGVAEHLAEPGDGPTPAPSSFS
jgi:hypothetical protein